jgi:D-amino-acid oxidase
MNKIAVIGAGVIGLTSAIRLLEQGYQVTIFARDILDNITSRAASALFVPIKAEPEKLILQWAKRTREVYQSLPPASGVTLIDIVDFRQDGEQIPLWARIQEDYHALPQVELPPPYTKSFAAKIHSIDTSLYIDYLIEQFKALGGKLIQQELMTLTDVDTAFSVVINCSGVWSQQLVPDKESFPIRGQFILTDKVGLHHATHASVDENNFILIAERENDCYIAGNTMDDVWDTKPDPKTSADMLERAQKLEPNLKNAVIRHAGIGLRPGRKSIRLERGTLADDRIVIHNYGHGGAGFTTAWGCADEVITLLMNAL